MGRNTEFRFGQIPRVNISRSVFKMKKNVKGSLNVGYIVPFYVNQDILPGDTFKVKQSIVLRMSTPIYPTMDNLVCDIYWFSEPWRRVWDNFKKFMGENEGGSWTQTTEYEIPKLRVKNTANGGSLPAKGSIWDYMGLPIGIKGADSSHPILVSALPFRAYNDIYNFFLRNENLIAPLSVTKTDTVTDYNISKTLQGGTPVKASRLPDYLSTCLPAPQKGEPVKIPIGTSAPIVFDNQGKALTLTDGTNSYGVFGNPVAVTGQGGPGGTLTGVLQATTGTAGLDIGSTPATANTEYAGGDSTTPNPKALGINLTGIADLSEATAATINALRLAFQTQKILEADARNGTRYFDEILNGHFGISSGAALFEKPRYLGGKRFPIVMNQVAQTSQTSDSSPLGQTGAFSITTDVDYMFTQSFTEHTILMGIMVIRQLSHTYQQKIARQWSRSKRLDLYWPELAHLGEQPVLNKEIYADGSTNDNEVFGYQERWAEYKYEDNVICGELRSTYSTPLDTWHYGDKYTSLPVLAQSWIEETDTYVKRTLAVQNHDQFIFDTDINITAIRPMPVYCTPGLIDHF